MSKQIFKIDEARYEEFGKGIHPLRIYTLVDAELNRADEFKIQIGHPSEYVKGNVPRIVGITE